jgi:hypothetical protein
MRNYDEHLEWCKQRAREYLRAGDLLSAVTSMMSDLDKHPETRAKCGRDSKTMVMLGIGAAVQATQGNHDFVQRYIEGFR